MISVAAFVVCVAVEGPPADEAVGGDVGGDLGRGVGCGEEHGRAAQKARKQAVHPGDLVDDSIKVTLPPWPAPMAQELYSPPFEHHPSFTTN